MRVQLSRRSSINTCPKLPLPSPFLGLHVFCRGFLGAATIKTAVELSNSCALLPIHAQFDLAIMLTIFNSEARVRCFPSLADRANRANRVSD